MIQCLFTLRNSRKPKEISTFLLAPALKTKTAITKALDNCRLVINGASEEVRTLDIHLGKVVLYQLSYAREKALRVNRLANYLPMSRSRRIRSLSLSDTGIRRFSSRTPGVGLW